MVYPRQDEASFDECSSGKSSLASAGLLAAIVENELDEAVAAWRSLIVTPADLASKPTAALVRLLASDDVLPGLTNAAIEAVNGLPQMAKRIARGFRKFHYFRLAAYLKARNLNLRVPHPLPT